MQTYIVRLDKTVTQEVSLNAEDPIDAVSRASEGFGDVEDSFDRDAPDTIRVTSVEDDDGNTVWAAPEAPVVTKPSEVHQGHTRLFKAVISLPRGLRFPMSMLRFDHAWPQNDDDAAAIEASFGVPEFTDPKFRTVILMSNKGFDLKRWDSFNIVASRITVTEIE